MRADAVSWYAAPQPFAGDPPGEDAVLLIGGFQGYANFGDVLQVKGVARWHSETTGLRAVPALSLTAVTDAGFDEVILYFNVGLKPHAQVKDEMARFMEQVAPQFR